MIFILIIRIWICIGITSKITKIINLAANQPIKNLTWTMSTSIVMDRGHQVGIYLDNLNKWPHTPLTSANIHAQVRLTAPIILSIEMPISMLLLIPRENLQSKLSQGIPVTKIPSVQGILKILQTIGMIFSRTAPRPPHKYIKDRAVTFKILTNRLRIIMAPKRHT